MQSIAQMPFVGGHVALDFVNTAEERGHPDADDALRTPRDLRLWGQRYCLLSPASESHSHDRAEMRSAIEARELLYTLFLDRVHNRTSSLADLERLATLAATAYRAASLEATSDAHLGWRWSSSELATIRHVVVTAAIDLLSNQTSQHLKQCPGEHCGWFFLDTTKRGNRRWCSMNECGQDAKAARRRARSTHQHNRRNQPPEAGTRTPTPAS